MAQDSSNQVLHEPNIEDESPPAAEGRHAPARAFMEDDPAAIEDNRPEGAPDPSSTRPALLRVLFTSPIAARILLVNVVALLLPAFSLLYLGPYADQLLENGENALQIHGVVLATAIVSNTTEKSESGDLVISIQQAERVAANHAMAANFRARLYGADGSLFLDTRRASMYSLAPDVGIATQEDLFSGELSGILGFVDQFLPVVEYRANLPTVPDQAKIGEVAELQQALSGLRASSLRTDENGRWYLTVAVPVQDIYGLLGAILLEQTGDHVQRSIREVRAWIFLLFLAFLVVTTALSLYLAYSVVRPIRWLNNAVERAYGRMPQAGLESAEAEMPELGNRKDEIADLAVALRSLMQNIVERSAASKQFADDVVHEVRNPLASMRSAMETLAGSKDPIRTQKMISVLSEDLDRVDRLITDIAFTSRIDRELVRVRPEQVDLYRLVHRYVKMRSSLNLSKVELVVHPPGPWSVFGVEDQILQALVNLIDNAADFSPEGDEIMVELRRTGQKVRSSFGSYSDKEADLLRTQPMVARVHLMVMDRGPGVPIASRQRIFGRFYSDRSLAEKNQSWAHHSGIGLSICKRIVESHGGELTAEDRPNAEHGACFHINFPAYR